MGASPTSRTFVRLCICRFVQGGIATMRRMTGGFGLAWMVLIAAVEVPKAGEPRRCCFEEHSTSPAADSRHTHSRTA